MWRTTLLTIGLAALAWPALAVTGRQEVVPAEQRILPYEANIPGCQDPSVLEKLGSHFAEKEAKFWNSSLTIVQYERIQRIAWRPAGLDYIPRRYCTGIATTSDGRKRRVDYSVREDLGAIGASWGIEFCLAGLDRNRSHAPGCRMSRP